jgi:hypothetical protein
VNRLVYIEQLSEINQPIAREKEIRSMTRSQKIKLIESIIPGWCDLRQPRQPQAPNPGFRMRQPRAGMTPVESAVALTHSPNTTPCQCPALVLMGNA